MRTTTLHPPLHRARRRRAAIAVALALVATSAALLPGRPAGAATTTIPITGRVSTTTGGGQSPSSAYGTPQLDGSGRYAFFDTQASLVAGDTNTYIDVYRKDRLTNQTERVSLLGDHDQIPTGGRVCDVSTTGRYVVFRTGGDTATATDRQLFRRDVYLDTTVLVSQNQGAPSNKGTDGGPCGISEDGLRVTFTSDSTNLGSDEDGQVYLRQIDSGATSLISRSTGGTVGNGDSFQVSISADGGVIAFMSHSTNLVSGDTNNQRDIFVRVLATNATQRVSTDGAGTQSNGDTQSPIISSNGRYVAFDSEATNLVPDDTNGARDVFRKDRQTGAVVRASVSNNGSEASGTTSSAAMTPDGRYIAFLSSAPNLYPADANGQDDVFRRDLTGEHTDLVSRRWDSVAPGNDRALDTPSISTDGRVVAFTGEATNLVPGDTNSSWDTFVRDFALDIAPFHSAKAFVTQQLVDFGPAGAFPTPGGVTSEAKVIQSGTRSPDGYLVDRARNATWAGKRPALIRLYWAYFLRAPDQGGMDYWTNQLTNGKTLAKVAAQFSQSSEFQTKYGSKTNEEFVTLIYQNIFERDPDAGGLSYWTEKLDTKVKTRGDVMVNFSESSEGRRFLSPQVDSVLIHLGMLRTMPTKEVLSAAIDAQRDGQPAESFAAQLRALPAYAARVTA